MSFIWLAAWLIKGRPKVRMFGAWNDWGIALAVTLALDLISAIGRAPYAARRSARLKSAPKTADIPEEVPASV